MKPRGSHEVHATDNSHPPPYRMRSVAIAAAMLSITVFFAVVALSQHRATKREVLGHAGRSKSSIRRNSAFTGGRTRCKLLGQGAAAYPPSTAHGTPPLK